MEVGDHGARPRSADEPRLSVWSENFGARRLHARQVGGHRDRESLYALKL